MGFYAASKEVDSYRNKEREARECFLTCTEKPMLKLQGNERLAGSYCWGWVPETADGDR